MFECIRNLSSLSAGGFKAHCRVVDRIELETPQVFVYLLACPICKRTQSFELPPTESGLGWGAEFFAWLKSLPVHEAARQLDELKIAA